jgi:hypothetical protein
MCCSCINKITFLLQNHWFRISYLLNYEVMLAVCPYSFAYQLGCLAGQMTLHIAILVPVVFCSSVVIVKHSVFGLNSSWTVADTRLFYLTEIHNLSVYLYVPECNFSTKKLNCARIVKYKTLRKIYAKDFHTRCYTFRLPMWFSAQWVCPPLTRLYYFCSEHVYLFLVWFYVVDRLYCNLFLSFFVCVRVRVRARAWVHFFPTSTENKIKLNVKCREEY